MPSSPTGAKNTDGGRVGGARADFVASLGRKVNDARELLALLEEDPASKSAREELRRRLHALGTGARLLRFDAMTQSLQEALAMLDRGAQTGAVREQDVGVVAQILDDLPALAWGEVPSRDPSGRERGRSADEAGGPMPVAALVVGEESLADALTDGGSIHGRTFECERTDDTDAALELARAHAPDVLLVDTDMKGAPELVEALLDDPLTDPVPVVVVGTFRSAEELARFVALGVARTLSKPIAPELLRTTVDEIVEVHDGRTLRVTLGEPTLEQLAERLAEELKHALVDSVDRALLSRRVPLGEGTEVLGALWGAIARVQEVISQKTAGAIRFGGEAPEGAIALAPWLHQDLPGADRLAGRGRGAAAEVRLDGRRVVVADDDPGVTWFVSDLLRTAGCEVHEALDGSTALALAHRIQPELVVSDILMPGIDGFALCRALRRDVALRDTPVILLSWKEDLLQRVRELGASAAAYMRKESGSRAILARVREVLRPRARIESRLRGDGEVRGRLDGLTPRLLLDLVCLLRKDARVSVRDATYLYEVEVRGGAPRKATRTASDGNYASGERALASLLGVGAGRFVVTPSREPIRGELTGTLFEQLLRPIAVARGALAATTGAVMANVARVSFDPQLLETYLGATPEPTRTLIKRLSLGTTPRQILLANEVSPSLLEDVLSDLAARGAIKRVEGANGVDLLTPAIDAALAVLQGEGERPRPVPPNARASPPPPPAAGPSTPARTARADSDPEGHEVELDPPASPQSPAYETFARSEPPVRPPAMDSDPVPSSLEDAVMREISDRSFQPRSSRAPTSDPPPIVEPSELRFRSSNPPDAPTEPERVDEQQVLPSIPPDAVVPAATPGDDLAGPAPAPTPLESPLGLGVGAAPAVPEQEPPSAQPTAVRQAAPSPQTPRRSRRPSVRLLALGLLAGLVVTVLHWTQEGKEPEPIASVVAPAPSPIASLAAAPPATGAASVSPADDDLPPGAEVPPGFGLLEVRAPVRAIVRIDGAVAGAGPYVAYVASPGYHEVRVDQAGHASTHVIEVRQGRATRIRSSPSP
jgi:DNA-binding response OmpR family regulator